MKLTNKVILLISPDPWSSIFISKHNYSVELAKKGNTVFFLNPIEHKLRAGQIRIVESGYNNLSVVHYELPFPLRLKFHLPSLFQWLMRWQAKRILKKIGRTIDIVWDFNPHPLFGDLRVFGAQVNIFHPVDKIMTKVNSRGANIIFSLSQEILDMVQGPKTPKAFINHGLSDHYIKKAMINGVSHERTAPIKVCYVGNLMIHSMDHQLMRSVVEQHKDLQFHFIGPYGNTDNPLGSSDSQETLSFISFLKKQPNVVLHGGMKNMEVAERLKEFDVFVICYKQSRFFSNDNSHKVLEYLSTGKVIVSTYIKQYENEDFIIMSPKDNNEAFKELFSRVVNDLERYSTEEVIKRRISYALNNSYEKQIARIEEKLATHLS